MFTPDGYDVIFKTSVLAVVLVAAGWFFGGWLLWLMLLLAITLMAFTLYFFRDPDRVSPEDDTLLIAPADGKVIEIVSDKDDKYLKSGATRISIFLSPLDVHVNRIPMSGKIEYLHYYPGQYLVAWHEKASELNERSEFGLLHSSGVKILFRQITGYVARRIVYHIKEGDEVKAGVRFGMMKFGSRMDILVKDDIRLTIKPGDRTIAGVTVMGELASK